MPIQYPEGDSAGRFDMLISTPLDFGPGYILNENGMYSDTPFEVHTARLSDCPNTSFTKDDVACILYYDGGEWGMEHAIGIGTLQDGRYFLLRSYIATEKAVNVAVVSDDISVFLINELTTREKERLGLMLG